MRLGAQWAATLAILALAIFANFMKNCYERGRHLNGIVLPDAGFDLIAERPGIRSITDAFVMSYGLSSILALMLFGKFGHLLIGLQMYVAVLAFNFVYAISTTLPDSKGGNCNPTVTPFGLCNDLGFSGHLATFIIASYVNSKLQDHKFAWAYAVASAVVAWAIIAARNHYTIDVLNSYVVCALLLTNAGRFPAARII